MRREDRSSISSEPLADLGGNQDCGAMSPLPSLSVQFLCSCHEASSFVQACSCCGAARRSFQHWLLCGHPEDLVLTAPSLRAHIHCRVPLPRVPAANRRTIRRRRVFRENESPSGGGQQSVRPGGAGGPKTSNVFLHGKDLVVYRTLPGSLAERNSGDGQPATPTSPSRNGGGSGAGAS